MAWMSQEHKKEIVDSIKPILKKYGVKASFSVSNHSKLNIVIKSGPIDFISNYNRVAEKNYSGPFEFKPITDQHYISVNHHHYDSNFDGEALKFLEEVIPAMYGARWFNESDIQSDYFHQSHYISVNIGTWNKPYEKVK